MIAPTAADPLCALCAGTGRILARAARAVPLGSRRVVVFARLIPMTVEFVIDPGAARSDDQPVTCPSCSETSTAKVKALEGAVVMVAQKTRRAR